MSQAWQSSCGKIEANTTQTRPGLHGHVLNQTPQEPRRQGQGLGERSARAKGDFCSETPERPPRPASTCSRYGVEPQRLCTSLSLPCKAVAEPGLELGPLLLELSVGHVELPYRDLPGHPESQRPLTNDRWFIPSSRNRKCGYTLFRIPRRQAGLVRRRGSREPHRVRPSERPPSRLCDHLPLLPGLVRLLLGGHHGGAAVSGVARCGPARSCSRCAWDLGLGLSSHPCRIFSLAGRVRAWDWQPLSLPPSPAPHPA